MMKKIVSLIYFISLFSSVALYASDGNKSTVFVVNSINNNELWTKMFSETVISKLENQGYNVMYTELNVPVMTSVDQCAEKCEQLLALSKEKPTIVVYIGDPGWLVTRKLFDKEWSDVPLFICHYRRQVPGTLEDLISKKVSEETLVMADDIRKDYCVTLMDRPILIKETITLMKELLPKMNRFVYLSDDRYISLMVKNDVEQILVKDFPELQFESLASQELSVEKLLDTLSSYDETVGIMYYSWFRVRSDNSSNFLEDNIHKVIYGFSKVPIFSLSDLIDGDDCFAGGCYVPQNEFVNNVVAAINNAINRPFKKGITKVIDSGKGERFLNYRHLQYHGVDPSLYPDDATYYQAPLGFYETYKVHIIAGSLILLFVIVLIIIMIRVGIHKVRQRNLKLHLLNEYRKLVDNMPMVYMRKKLVEGGNYVLKDVNTAFEVLFDCNRSMIIGKELSQLVAEKENLSALMNTSNWKNISVNNKFGEQRYFDRIILKDDETNIIEEFWVDATEEYKISQEKENNRLKLNELNGRYELVLKAANFAIWEYDLVKATLYCNVTYFLSGEKNYNMNEFTVPVDEFLSRVHEDDREVLLENLNGLVSGTQDIIHYEYRLINYFDADSRMWIECNAVVNKRDSSGKVLSVIGAATDITKRKNLEDDLLNAKICAEESNLLKSAFLANMSHEIRTPLNAIVGFSNVLAKTDNEVDRLEYLSIIETNNELLLRLVGDILDLSKIDAGLLEFEYGEVNITGLFSELEQEMNYNIKSNVKIFFDNRDIECVLYTERNRLLQVMKNLLTNAIKFTAAGEIHFGYKTHKNNMTYFYVADSGCGIAKEQLEGVFERFVKLNAFVQGTGLGLSICKTIVSRLGGEIGVDSEVGVGSKFWFTIPNGVIHNS